METSLHYVNLEDMKRIKNNLKCFVGEINYTDINCDYLNKVGNVFGFPVFEEQKEHSWDEYSDWMTDLSWYNDEEWVEITNSGYNLIIWDCTKNW
ncbi:MAG: hypothetical protein K2K57_00820 [Oscillospiraceae bacterium]|nr:hypothetical protein [Oscillospiraceae bacterium]